MLVSINVTGRKPGGKKSRFSDPHTQRFLIEIQNPPDVLLLSVFFCFNSTPRDVSASADHTLRTLLGGLFQP